MIPVCVVEKYFLHQSVNNNFQHNPGKSRQFPSHLTTSKSHHVIDANTKRYSNDKLVEKDSAQSFQKLRQLHLKIKTEEVLYLFGYKTGLSPP